MLRFSLLLLCFVTFAACDSADPVEQPPVFSHEIEVTALPDTTLDIDAVPLVINLHDVFEHRDGLALSFDAPRLEGTSVTMEVQDSLVTLTPALHGESTIRLAASALDGVSAEAEMQIMTNVPDRIVLSRPLPDLMIPPYAYSDTWAIRFDASEFVDSISGSKFSFSVISTHPEIVQADITGTEVRIFYVAQGQSTIILTVDDHGKSKEFSFSATTLPPPPCPEPPPGFTNYFGEYPVGAARRYDIQGLTPNVSWSFTVQSNQCLNGSRIVMLHNELIDQDSTIETYDTKWTQEIDGSIHLDIPAGKFKARGFHSSQEETVWVALDKNEDWRKSYKNAIRLHHRYGLYTYHYNVRMASQWWQLVGYN